MNHIRFINSKVISLEILEDMSHDENFELSVGVGYPADDHKVFGIEFKCQIFTSEHLISVQYSAVFETDDDIDDDFRNSHFPQVNAPAIAYPFLRSFISTLTINAGIEPVIIPTINFQALNNK